MSNIPKHILDSNNCTGRQWKSKKRKEIKDALEAIHEIYLGCAYMPGGLKILGNVRKSLERLQGFCSVKKWGR